jgi:ketosteroid isomerase-like protein
MNKFTALLTMGLVLASVCQPQDDQTPNPEMQRQEIINLENEAARAIQQSNGTFFRRVYSDDFSGTLSHGQPVNKALWIDAVQASVIKYDSFIASDIKVRIYQDTAVATGMWSSRAVYKGQRINSQMRVVHVYVNTPRGWHVVAGQATLLPPNVEQPL